MKSIAVTKPDMGVLSRQRLPLSPFGALAQAFGEELLARAEQGEGRWSYVPLELLEEGEEALPPSAPSRVELHVDFQLVLEALRREESRTEQHRATERIVERLLRLQQERTPGPAVEKTVSQTVIRPLYGTGIIRQEFHQSLTQNLHVAAADSRGQVPTGALARQAEAFSRNLQLLREEGRPSRQEIPLPQGQAVVLPVAEQENSGMTGERVTSAPAADRRTSFMEEQLLPREELTLLEEAGREAKETQSQVFQREADRLGRLVERTVEEAVRAGAAEQTPRTADRPGIMEQRSHTIMADRPEGHGTPERLFREDQRTAEDLQTGAIPWREVPTMPPADRPLSAYKPMELTHRTEEEGEKGRAEQPGASPPDRRSANGVEKKEDAVTSQSIAHTARDIRMSSRLRFGDVEHVEKSTAPSPLSGKGIGQAALVTGAAGTARTGSRPAGQDQTRPTADAVLPAYGPVELEHRSEGKTEEGKMDRSGSRQTAGKPHIEQSGQIDRPRRQTEDRMEKDTAVISQTAQQRDKGPKTARDIRASALLMEQDKEAPAAGHMLPAYGLVELEHRSEGEAEQREADRSGSRQTAGKPRAEQVGQTDRSHRQTEGRTEETFAAVSPIAGRREGVQTARDIRVSAPPVEPDEKVSTVNGMFPAYGPVELEHRWEQDTKPGEGGQPWTEQAGPADRLHRQAEGWTEKSTAAVSPTVQRQDKGPQTARDIRVSAPPAGERETLQTADSMLPAYGPVELEHRSEGETEQREADRTDSRQTARSPEPGQKVSAAASDILADQGKQQKTVLGFAAAGRMGSITARDIRTGGEIPQGEGRTKDSGWSLPPAGLTLNRSGDGDGTTSITDLPLAAERKTEANQSHAGTPVFPVEPVPLTYGPVQGGAGGESQATSRSPDAPEQEESEYVRNLPDWARNFLKNSWNESGSSGAMGVAREIAVLPQPEEQVQWTAPNYHPPEASVVYREKERSVQPPSRREPQISETELQRTADRVYRMIEERIRRERRRLGL
ncbi:hypothetical protein [uncultured Flavonifractor sp.]|uniref:hypothetical protein n=1 Tax=uncultured Flavonifractor sp. TaxID=1193534 RepID=UPI002636B23D|nr:hypothetical protein [uncultured Flavonifractor sp.]